MSHYPEHYDCNHSKEDAAECPACFDVWCPVCEEHSCSEPVDAGPEWMDRREDALELARGES